MATIALGRYLWERYIYELLGIAFIGSLLTLYNVRVHQIGVRAIFVRFTDSKELVTPHTIANRSFVGRSGRLQPSTPRLHLPCRGLDMGLVTPDFTDPTDSNHAYHFVVGNQNELNAAYAADGYARVKGIPGVCQCTTVFA